jgi:hypothetical protein
MGLQVQLLWAAACETREALGVVRRLNRCTLALPRLHDFVRVLRRIIQSEPLLIAPIADLQSIRRSDEQSLALPSADKVNANPR